jgi:hypothetical protein
MLVQNGENNLLFFHIKNAGLGANLAYTKGDLMLKIRSV